jgi:hypothetical protein
MNWPQREREIGYYHPTPKHVTEALLKVEKFPGKIWEPACGEGAISRVLEAHGLDVYSSDEKYRGYGEVADFFDTAIECDHVITNPVWLDTDEIRWHFWVAHALYVAKRKVALLMPMYFWDSALRRRFLRTSPLKALYLFEETVFSGRHVHAWWVWQRGWKKEPVIRWIAKSAK